MASSGFQADVKALQKVLSARHLVSQKLETAVVIVNSFGVA